jgi:hypothetical protein
MGGSSDVRTDEIGYTAVMKEGRWMLRCLQETGACILGRAKVSGDVCDRWPVKRIFSHES